MISCQSYPYACFFQDSGCFEIRCADLVLAARSQRRAYDGRKAALGNLFGDQMPFGAVIERQIQMKFLRNADGCQNVIGAVNMRF